jgi:hypothetical protein
LTRSRKDQAMGKRYRLSEPATAFSSNEDMIQTALKFINLRIILHSQPYDHLIDLEARWTNFWHERFDCAPGSTPLGEYMVSKQLSGIEQEILMTLLANKGDMIIRLYSINSTDIAQIISNPRFSKEDIGILLQRNSPLYMNRVIYHDWHWLISDDEETCTFECWILLDTILYTMVFPDFPLNYSIRRILAQTEEGFLVYLKKLVRWMYGLGCRKYYGQKCTCIPTYKWQIHLLSSLLLLNLSNYSEWNLASMACTLHEHQFKVVAILIGKKLGWIPADSPLCTIRGLAAATRGLDGSIKEFWYHYFDEDAPLIDERWIQPDQRFSEPGLEDIFELHPEAVERLGL